MGLKKKSKRDTKKISGNTHEKDRSYFYHLYQQVTHFHLELFCKDETYGFSNSIAASKNGPYPLKSSVRCGSPA